MNAETLLENFEVLAEAPGGIGFLKKLILVNAASGAFLQNGRHSGSANSKKTLGELCDIYQPKTISIRELIEDGKYLVYGANGVIGRYDKFNHEFEEVLVTCRGATCGTVNVSSPKSWINGNAMVVRPKTNELSKKFLAVILRGVDYASVITGTAQPQITRQPLSKISIFVPTVAEQKRIVTKVDELMALCDQLEQQQHHRNNLRTSTRKSAIGAISTATTPEELDTAWKRINYNWDVIADTTESVSSLRSLILDLAVRGRLGNGVEQKFDAISGLPVIWKIQRLDQVCTYLHRGKGPKYSDMSRCAVVSQKCVQWTGFDISKARFVDEQSLNSYGEERILRNGDILWNSTGTGTVGRTAVYFDSYLFEKVVADSHVTVLRAPGMNPQFLWSWTASPAVQSIITDLTSGTTNQQELNLSSIKSLLVPVPPFPEQNRIVTKVEELMALCDQLEAELKSRSEVAEKFGRSVVSAA